MRVRRRTSALAFAAVVALATACANAPRESSTPDRPPAAERLAGTSWQLVRFQSSSDEVGTLRPDDGSLYTMDLIEDGTVAMRLNCNRAYGTWTVDLAPGDSGAFQFGPLLVTRALCPPPSMDARIARDAEYVRSFVLRDGKLYLSLVADGGIYTWEPRP